LGDGGLNMKWQNILKDNRTEIISILEEGILPGYSIRLKENHIGSFNAFVIVSKFPKLENTEFRLYDLHIGFTRPGVENASDEESWREMADKVKPAIVGLDLFLREVDRDNNFDKIDSHNHYMTLSSDRLKFKFALGRSCDSSLMDPEGYNEAKMCLDFVATGEKPVLGDAWLTTYTLAKILVNAPLSTVREMVRNKTIPQVLEGAMEAILADNYSIKCDFCENFTADEEQCDECGYFIDVDEDGDITVHEGVEPWKIAYPTGWTCPNEHPNDRDFIFYGSMCERHGVEPSDYGPSHGFDYLGNHLELIEAYIWNGNVVGEGFGDLIPLADILNHYPHEETIDDLTDHYTIEELPEILNNFTAEDIGNDNWKLVIGNTTYIWDGDSLREYDEEE